MLTLHPTCDLSAEVLPPVEIGQPPADFPFKLAGYTDVAPEEFVYAKTPGGNWVAAAQDPQGRLYMIDQVGDLYYDSGNPEIGMYVVGSPSRKFSVCMLSQRDTADAGFTRCGACLHVASRLHVCGG
jgi:hypothetical protein